MKKNIVLLACPNQFQRFSASCNQMAEAASLGIRQSPQGLRLTLPTFRAIWQTAALELLIEETAHEGLQPLLNGFLIIAVRIIITDLYTLQFGINKCLLCQHVNLGRTETETQEIVEEENHAVRMVPPNLPSSA